MHPDTDMYDVVIVGGGITGLSAAWEIQTGAGHSEPRRYLLLEKDVRLGGKIQTVHLKYLDGMTCIIDGGPESFITRKPEVWDLAHELGAQDALQAIQNEASHMFVLNQGKPERVPLDPLSFIGSGLLSPKGKLRILAEPLIAPRVDDEDESLAEFVTRRLGREALDQLVGPILGGIYNTDPERQSILTTSPVMREMEREHGSLVKAMIARAMAGRKNRHSGYRRPRFVTFHNGAEQLPARLAEKLVGEIRTQAAVTAIDFHSDSYQVRLDDGQAIRARSVILATPANISARLLKEPLPGVAAALAEIRHDPIGTISLIYRASEVNLQKRIHGLMIPRREKRRIDAIQFPSLKLEGRAPEGALVARIFFGGAAPEMVALDDASLLSRVREELKDLLGIDALPIGWAVFRWMDSFPQADIGHLNRVDRIEAALPPGIQVAGSSYHGIGVPDCIRDGRAAAAKVLEQLALTEPGNSNPMIHS